ncbi:ABC transporter ATP-binding protein [Actinobacteria bacterium YIM 96077]|uniref:Peptide ABC transporter ATP-binding protein n=2 Tax=Phytoactinopolyspora halophila TaxID=1981511 RepID=A0A329QIA0_9ACTN|nr:ABC transporter ATP-binding protein [Actinobacteria bacterium YIM 96077]RAW12054.1 peptide ABC transporter ATP-binding protein [Phytoactinopolyspora halophila]
MELIETDSISPSPDRQKLLRVEGLSVEYPILSSVLRRKLGTVSAVHDVSFDLLAGEALGLVGESGCGKSTTGMAILGLIQPSKGRIIFDGNDVTQLSKRDIRKLRREMQIVLQDPFSSLNPRMTVRAIVAEPLQVHGAYGARERAERVDELLALVGLEPEHGRRYPHEFSGGQRQRICIARALALNPRLLVLDEPLSALDVSIQAQVIELLESLRKQLSLSYLLISHDLSVVRHVCDRVAVMYFGELVEIGAPRDIYENPSHPYTEALLSAVPVSDPRDREAKQRVVLEGGADDVRADEIGCSFRGRCWKAAEVCENETPELADRAGVGHESACHFPGRSR